MGRLNTMTDLAASSSIVSATTYDSASRMLTMSGGFSETRTYNSIGQLITLSNNLVSMTYSYSATQNNGKITGQTDAISGEQVVYAYDALNRLASASATNGSWGQSYSYDGFGNLTGQTVTAGTAPSMATTYNPANNRQTGECADANGNINSATNCLFSTSYTYDVENRIAAVPGNTRYAYAPGNKRIWRGTTTGTTLSVDEITFWSVTGQKLATYNISGDPAVLYSTTPSLTATIAVSNYYFGGKLIGKLTTGMSSVTYLGSDRLGSIGKYYPWGQEKPSATQNGTEKFTGYFRDSETALDYADQRYHQPGVGRFLSPDPYRASAGSRDPGSWNRYSYAGGDPVNRKDPSGQDWCEADDYGDECLLPANPYGWDINDQILASLAGVAASLAAELSGLTDQDKFAPRECDIKEQITPVPGTFHAGVHTYLDVEINSVWSTIEVTSSTPNPLTKNAQMDALITAGQGGGLNIDHPGTDKTLFDAQKDTNLTPQQLCDDAQAVMNAATSFQKNHAPGSPGALPYNLLGRNGVANSNSFIRYLLTFAPDLGNVPHSKRAVGWNNLVLVTCPR